MFWEANQVIAIKCYLGKSWQFLEVNVKWFQNLFLNKCTESTPWNLTSEDRGWRCALISCHLVFARFFYLQSKSFHFMSFWVSFLVGFKTSFPVMIYLLVCEFFIYIIAVLCWQVSLFESFKKHIQGFLKKGEHQINQLSVCKYWVISIKFFKEITDYVSMWAKPFAV